MGSDIAIVIGLAVAAAAAPLAAKYVRVETTAPPARSRDGKWLVWPGWVAVGLAVMFALFGVVITTGRIGDMPFAWAVAAIVSTDLCVVAFIVWVARTRVTFDEGVISARTWRSGWVRIRWTDIVQVGFRPWSVSIVLDDRSGQRISVGMLMRGSGTILAAIEQRVPHTEGKSEALERARRHIGS